MDDQKDIEEDVVSKDVTENGKTVTIIARLKTDELWELSIHGKENQFTTWTDWYPTSEEAIEAGMLAILTEGLTEFYSNSDFEY